VRAAQGAGAKALSAHHRATATLRCACDRRAKRHETFHAGH
jgi:hypothetical protein